MHKLPHLLMRLIFPPLIFISMQFLTTYLALYAYGFYLGGSPEALMQSALTVSAHPVTLLILAALLTIPLLLWLFSRDIEKRPPAPAPAKGLGVTLLWTAVFGLGLCLSLNTLMELSPLAQYASGFEDVSNTLYGTSWLQQLLGLVLIIPLCEELVFRALMFRGLRDELPFWAAALLSSLAFALYHGNLYQGVYAFCLGFFMAWAYERLHVFLAPVILHTSANLFSVLLSNPAINTWLANHAALFGTLIIALFALTIISLIMIKRRTKTTA